MINVIIILVVVAYIGFSLMSARWKREERSEKRRAVRCQAESLNNHQLEVVAILREFGPANSQTEVMLKEKAQGAAQCIAYTFTRNEVRVGQVYTAYMLRESRYPIDSTNVGDYLQLVLAA